MGTHRRLAAAVLQQMWRDAQIDARAALAEVRSGYLDHWLSVLALDRPTLVARLEHLAAEQPLRLEVTRLRAPRSRLYDLTQSEWLDVLIDAELNLYALAARFGLSYHAARAAVVRCLGKRGNDSWQRVLQQIAPELSARAAKRNDAAARHV